MSKKTAEARIQAAAIREELEAKDRKTRRLLYGTTAVVMVAILGAAVFASNKEQAKTDPGKVNAKAAAPKGAFPAGHKLAYGIPYGTNAKAPVLELWEDFQCPACKAVEAAAGKNIRALADDGKIRLVYRVVNFLDINLRNDSSTRAANAFGCAVDQGAGANYHDYIYANQPATEGVGYTDAALTMFAKNSGITGEAFKTWQRCVDNRTYKDWVANSMDQFTKKKHTATPTAVLAGTKLDNTVLIDPTKLAAAVAKATK